MNLVPILPSMTILISNQKVRFRLRCEISKSAITQHWHICNLYWMLHSLGCFTIHQQWNNIYCIVSITLRCHAMLLSNIYYITEIQEGWVTMVDQVTASLDKQSKHTLQQNTFIDTWSNYLLYACQVMKTGICFMYSSTFT